jgi:hypothetical protein
MIMGNEEDKKYWEDSEFYKKMHKWEECGVHNPPMNGQEAINLLCHYLLGEDYSIDEAGTAYQANTIAVLHILNRYSRKFRSERRKYLNAKKKEMKENGQNI